MTSKWCILSFMVIEHPNYCLENQANYLRGNVNVFIIRDSRHVQQTNYRYCKDSF